MGNRDNLGFGLLETILCIVLIATIVTGSIRYYMTIKEDAISVSMLNASGIIITGVRNLWKDSRSNEKDAVSRDTLVDAGYVPKNLTLPNKISWNVRPSIGKLTFIEFDMSFLQNSSEKICNKFCRDAVTLNINQCGFTSQKCYIRFYSGFLSN